MRTFRSFQVRNWFSFSSLAFLNATSTSLVALEILRYRIIAFLLSTYNIQYINTIFFSINKHTTRENILMILFLSAFSNIFFLSTNAFLASSTFGLPSLFLSSLNLSIFMYILYLSPSPDQSINYFILTFSAILSMHSSLSLPSVSYSSNESTM